MHTTRRLFATLLPAFLLLAPAAVLAQEVGADERPDPGFRVLGPRTVVSFVRESLDGLGPEEAPRWRAVVHVSNVGNAPMIATTLFVASSGDYRAARRFPVAPGQTVSVPVERILAARTDVAPPADDSGVVTGIVLVRFFVPTDADTDRFFAQMVTAEQFLDTARGGPPVIVPLDVERPTMQGTFRRRMVERER